MKSVQKTFIILTACLVVLILAIIGCRLFYFHSQAKNDDRLFSEGIAALKSGDSYTAFARFTALKDQQPDDPEVNYGLFLSSIDLNYLEEAAKAFAKILPEQRRKQSETTYVNMITMAHRLAFSDLAERWLAEATKIFGETDAIKKIQQGHYPYLQVKRPLPSDKSRDFAPSQSDSFSDASAVDLDSTSLAAAYKDGDYAGIAKALSSNVGTGDLTETQAILLAKSYIMLNQAEAYTNLVERLTASGKFNAKNRPNYYGTTIGNMQNGGEAIRIDGEIYAAAYSTYFLQKWPASMLEKSRAELAATLPKPKVIADIPVACLNWRDGWLYYVDRRAGNICRRHLADGRTETIIAVKADYMILAGTKLFYRDTGDGRKLKKIDLTTLLRDEHATIASVGKNLRPEVCLDMPIRSYTMDGEHIFAIRAETYQVMSYNLQTGEVQQLPLDETEEIVSNGVNLFYVNIADGNRLWTSDADGGRSRRLLQAENISNLHLKDRKTLLFSNWQLQEINLSDGKIDILNDFSTSGITSLGDRFLVANETLDRFKYLVFPDTGAYLKIEP